MNISPSHLLAVVLGVWQHGGDVEHDLVLLERRVDRVRARLVLVHVQPAPETFTKLVECHDTCFYFAAAAALLAMLVTGHSGEEEGNGPID